MILWSSIHKLAVKTISKFCSNALAFPCNIICSLKNHLEYGVCLTSASVNSCWGGNKQGFIACPLAYRLQLFETYFLFEPCCSKSGNNKICSQEKKSPISKKDKMFMARWLQRISLRHWQFGLAWRLCSVEQTQFILSYEECCSEYAGSSEVCAG